MKKKIKNLLAVVLYMLFLCSLLKTEAILLFSPRHIGMFLLGCIILCLPYLERKIEWKELGMIFRKNAIMAGYLETFMLIFVAMIQKKMVWEELLAELALALRPLFYGFVCYTVMREEPLQQNRKEEKTKQDMEQPKEVRREPDLTKLTRQEKQIVQMIKRGLTNREIGEELCISETTVKKHVSNIFGKLEISSRKELR